VDDGFSVELIEIGEDPCFEFVLGCDANAAEHGPSHLGEEAFDKIEPRAMFRSKHKGEAALGLGSQPPLGFLGSVGRVVVEDQLDGGLRWVSGIDFLEKTDELPRAMAIFDAGVNLAREQVDPGEQAQRAMTLVFMITRPARMRPRLRSKVGGGAANRLNARLLSYEMIATFG
jgi:hypothetical protein